MPIWSPTNPAYVFSERSSRSTIDRRDAKLISGQDDLLADNPSLARSVFNRFPHLELLNHLQVELLRRYRSGENDEFWCSEASC